MNRAATRALAVDCVCDLIDEDAGNRKLWASVVEVLLDAVVLAAVQSKIEKRVARIRETGWSDARIDHRD